MSSVVRVTRWNNVPALYSRVLELQDSLFKLRKEDRIDDTILVLQHKPVYTMGKRGSLDDFQCDRQELLRNGIEIVTVPRGGETTYHGPGQIVAYPIVQLRQLGLGARAYVESLEDAMIDTAALYGLECKGRIPGKTGVWVDERKIGAVGVAISGGVTRHGIAFNADPDVSAFHHIVACGEKIPNATSLAIELGMNDLDVEDVSVQLTKNLLDRLGFTGNIKYISDVQELL